jgi:hypothetical protein
MFGGLNYLTCISKLFKTVVMKRKNEADDNSNKMAFKNG